MDGQMMLPGIDLLEWQYDEDTGNVLCRCPDCGGRMVIGLYTYHNPYHFCPYCGIRLDEGKIRQMRAQVYGEDRA